MHYKRTKKSINEFVFDIWAGVIFLFSCLVTLALIYKCQGVSIFISDNIDALLKAGISVSVISPVIAVATNAKNNFRICFLIALTAISFLIACSLYFTKTIPPNILGELAIINIYIFFFLMAYFAYLHANKRGKTAKSIIDDLIKGNDNDVVELGKRIGSNGDSKDILFFNELVQETLLRSGKLLQGDDKKSAPKREELYYVQYKLCHLVVRYCITTNPNNMNTVSDLFENIFYLCREYRWKQTKSTEYINNASFENLTAGAISALLKNGEDNKAMEVFLRKFLYIEDTFYEPIETYFTVYTIVAAYCQLLHNDKRLNPWFQKIFVYDDENIPHYQSEPKEYRLFTTIKGIWSKCENNINERAMDLAIEDIKHYDKDGYSYHIKCKF